jgi:hypothetical protein
VEVAEDAGYSNFYNWYRQEGRKRKVYLRSSSREMRRADNLDVVLAAQLRAFGGQISAHKLTILKKRKYARLLSTAANALPGGKIVSGCKSFVTAACVPQTHHPGGSTRELDKTFRRYMRGAVAGGW